MAYSIRGCMLSPVIRRSGARAAPQDGGFKITKSEIACEAKVRGLNQAAFAKHAETARANCPVSQALAGIDMTLDAKLVPE